MTGHIVFNGVSIDNIIDEIEITKERTYNTSAYVGTTGSTTMYVSETSRVITCQSICPFYEESVNGDGHRIDDYRSLEEEFRAKTGVLTTSSNLELKGNYLITKFDVVEDTGGNFRISWEFQEVVPFNLTRRTFRVWGSSNTSSSSTSSSSSSSSSVKGASLPANTRLLLKDCGLMSQGSTSTNCVKALQTFLQAGGFYTGYKVDGVYGTYTVNALKKAQSARGLKVTGAWDEQTRSYYQKKYNYP